MLKKGSGSPEQAEITAFLGKGTEFKGVLSFEGTIRVDGKVEGEVVSKDTLIAGDEALLQGEITVGTIISSGKIVGNVTATQKVHMLAPGQRAGQHQDAQAHHRGRRHLRRPVRHGEREEGRRPEGRFPERPS